jgi:hypothetical protein
MGGDGGGDGGGGGDGSNGGVGDGGVSDNSGSSDSGGFSVGDVGGFGDNASLSDADAAAAATTGVALGDFGSLSDFGGIGVGVPGGFGSVSGLNGVGEGIGEGLGGFGSIGGLGIGNAPAAGSIGGIGGFGGFGAPGGFGNTGISDPGDASFGNIAGIGPSAAAMGLSPSNGLGFGPAAQASLGNSVSAALGTLGENIGTPASPATAAVATGYGNLAAGLNAQQASLAAATADNAVSSEPTAEEDAATLAQINQEAINLGYMTAEGLPGKGVTTTSTSVNNATFGPTVAEGLASQASNQAHANLANSQPANNFGNLAGEFGENFGQTGVNIGFQGFSPSPTGVAGVSPGINTGFAGFSPSPATAAAPSALGTATSGSPSVSAALANAVNADTGFGVGGGLNFINPAGSILLAQYPWLGFQPTS